MARFNTAFKYFTLRREGEGRRMEMEGNRDGGEQFNSPDKLSCENKKTFARKVSNQSAINRTRDNIPS